MADSDYLIQSRGHLRSRVTRLYDKICDSSLNMTLIEKQSGLNALESLQAEIKNLNESICASLWQKTKDESKLSAEFDICETYNNKIREGILILKADIADATSITEPRVLDAQPRLNKLKLPEVPLPTYSHSEGETLNQFFENFETILCKYDLSDYEKFVYLKRQLRNEPLTLINSLSGAKQSYEGAKSLLEEAFADVIAQKYDAIRRLSNLRLTKDGDPYQFISEMKLVQDLFRTLSVDVGNVLQYFIWHGMSSGLQNQFVAICNTNKPNLDEINRNVFKALDRLREISSRTVSCEVSKFRSTSKSFVQSFAANVNPGKTNLDRKGKLQFCSLCSNTDKARDISHSTRNCPMFATPKSKVERLKALGACTICGYSNHTTRDCTFKFNQRCIHCQGNHMSFLCINNISPKESTQNPKTKSKTSASVNTGGVWAETVFQVNVGGEAILPTFTCIIGDCKVRAMKDSGCQPNFILTSLANRLKLPVLYDNCSINVNGFNESKRYVTKVVSVPLRVGGVTHQLKAICVPSINTTLKLPGLSLVTEEFLRRGYTLADQMLPGKDVIEDIDFILGMNDPRVLLETQIPFGSQGASIFSRTSAGVLLYGSLEQMKENLTSLPFEDSISTPKNKPIVSREVEEEIIPPDISDASSKLEARPAAASLIEESELAFDADGELDATALEKATEKMLQSQCEHLLQYDEEYNEDSTEENDNIVRYVLSTTTRTKDGRLEMPLTWREDVLPFLGKNFNMSKKILNGMQRLPREKLEMIDECISEWEQSAIVERIEDLDAFLEDHPVHSFLPHMAVFRLSRETTKCRVVFLSNLSERRGQRSISMNHNQVMRPGPNLNQKLTTAIMHLRFGESALCYDLKKAFLQIALRDCDSDKLLFLWFRNVRDKDFRVVAYRNLRLTFGLRCSPTILMLAMYKILCVDGEHDSEEVIKIKRMLYSLMYMDNGAFTGTRSEVEDVHKKIPDIFGAYCFEIQQLVTNDQELQAKIDEKTGVATPNVVKMLGLEWDREKDKLFAKKLCLDEKASTKRQVLQTIASQFDPFNFQGPCLNRARLFMHSLQISGDISWDEKLSLKALKEWQTIARQANKTPLASVDRSAGSRSDEYELIAFTDASKSIYAAVIYLKNVTTNSIKFWVSKNRLVNRQLELKTIPTLELQAITLGVELLFDVKEELSGEKCLFPIKITCMRLFTDSSISLHWLQAQSKNLAKMQSKSVFVMNRLAYIERQCSKFPIQFNFVATGNNPADCMTRALSYSMLKKSDYVGGPSFLTQPETLPSDLSVTIPCYFPEMIVNEHHVSIEETEELINVANYSNLKRLVRVTTCVFRFVEALKAKVKLRSPSKFLELGLHKETHEQRRRRALYRIIADDQRKWFPEVFSFFSGGKMKIKDIPVVVSDLNVFLDRRDGVLKVKSKFDRWRGEPNFCFPILLSHESALTKLVVNDAHERLAHSGRYALLAHLRKQFYVPKFFSTIKKVLQNCVVCRRFNARSIKLNQSSYRDFRVNPPSEPYRFVFIDHLGPFAVQMGELKKKVWLLCVTCLWSRAVNLVICPDLTVKGFLRALQIHVFAEGLPNMILSDLGSQFTAGAAMIRNFLNNSETQTYLADNGINNFQFEHYFKGNSSLGSLVEVCVKFTKRLIYGTIRNNVLCYHDFELIIAQTVHIINKRPVAFKEALRDEESLDVPAAISPELLCKGREIISLNIIPPLQPDPDGDPEWKATIGSQDSLRSQYAKLRKVRSSLIKIYNDEFFQTLMKQGLDQKGRYKPVTHHSLQVGDLVLLRDPLLKTSHFPMARVKEVVRNASDEVTGIVVIKGNTRETVRRHVNSVIPLLRPEVVSEDKGESNPRVQNLSGCNERRSLKRIAARNAGRRFREMIKEGLV